MRFAVAFVVLSIVGCRKSVLCVKDFGGEASANECSSGVHLNTYGVYLIGFAMFLMFLAIIYLTYALVKAKGQQYKIMSDISQAATNGPTTQSTFTRQESQIPICPNTAPITPVEDIRTEDSFFLQSESVRHLERNGASTSTINKYESKVLPIVKRSVKTNLMLPPEQMREICKGVLQNRKSNKDLNEFLESFERRPSRKLSKKGLAREKSASTPELDLITQDELYDVLPAMGSTDKIDDDNGTKRNSKEREEGRFLDLKGKENDDDEPIEHLDDIYDSPGVSTTKKIIVEDKEYLIVIDPALDCEPTKKEPSYTNANTNDYIL